MKIWSKLLELQLSSLKKDVTFSFLKMIDAWIWGVMTIYWYADWIDVETLNRLVWFVDKVVNKYFKHYTETMCSWNLADMIHWNETDLSNFISEDIGKIIYECSVLASAIVRELNKFIYDGGIDEKEEMEKKILNKIDSLECLFRLEDEDKWEI